ncbi:hypothetical protein [Paenibacillus xylanexedens]|uniref:hypothetical protein n=1 Tax=Paenibacillus xylanexedens TaxID=528191 RepID=UPI000F524701|nr:hypothetical protein [Paenibacillus xylanexedens]RPK20121.1 hypothetical protein EDO6_06660 [Paenibacillus xylanexedens]
MITLTEKSAIAIIQSIIIRLDDEDFSFSPEELEAYGELYRGLSQKAKQEVKHGMHECYSETFSPGAYVQLTVFVETGENIKKEGD